MIRRLTSSLRLTHRDETFTFKDDLSFLSTYHQDHANTFWAYLTPPPKVHTKHHICALADAGNETTNLKWHATRFALSSYLLFLILPSSPPLSSSASPAPSSSPPPTSSSSALPWLMMHDASFPVSPSCAPPPAYQSRPRTSSSCIIFSIIIFIVSIIIFMFSIIIFIVISNIKVMIQRWIALRKIISADFFFLKKIFGETCLSSGINLSYFSGAKVSKPPSLSSYFCTNISTSTSILFRGQIIKPPISILLLANTLLTVSIQSDKQTPTCYFLSS